MSNSRARLLQSRQLGLGIWELSVCQSLGPKPLKASLRLEQGGQVEFVYREETPFRQALGLSLPRSQALSPKFQGGGLPCGPVCFDSHNCGKVHRLAHESKKEEHAWSGVFWSEVEHDSAGLDWTRF